MPQVYKTKMLIIGSGPAGCTAAIYGARACLDPIMVCGKSKGGQLTITTDVENYPGFATAIQGPWLMEQMIAQAQHCGTNVIEDNIESINLTRNEEGFLQALDSNGNQYLAGTVIISTGANAKWLGLKNEEKFLGRGVSGCATCDGFFFRGKVVMVVGGGNTAVEEALYLTNHASKVFLIHRRDTLRADKTLQRRAMSHPKIEIVWNKVLNEILGDDKVGVYAAQIKDTIDGKITELGVDGIFIAIGHKPNTELFKPMIVTDEEGYIVVQNNVMTNIEGVYACGDVCDKKYRQAVVAAGNGCIAALEAESYLSINGKQMKFS